jgi:hypothetical protein
VTKRSFDIVTLSDPWADARAHVLVSRRSYSDLLFPKPTFWKGVGSCFDVFGARGLYSYSDSEDEADSRALAGDWITVGNDLWHAIKVYDEHEVGNEDNEHDAFVDSDVGAISRR